MEKVLLFFQQCLKRLIEFVSKYTKQFTHCVVYVNFSSFLLSFLFCSFIRSHTKILSKHRVLGNSLKNTVCPQISRAAFTLSARSSYTDTHTKSNVDRSKFFERSERFEPRAILYQSASVMLYTKRL